MYFIVKIKHICEFDILLLKTVHILFLIFLLKWKYLTFLFIYKGELRSGSWRCISGYRPRNFQNVGFFVLKSLPITSGPFTIHANG